MKVNLLLRAADIVEKPNSLKPFYMANVNYCILGQCMNHEGFEDLRHAEYHLDYLGVAAKFFDLTMEQSAILFEPDWGGKAFGTRLRPKATRAQAASFIRKMVKKWNPKPKKLTGKPGMRVLKKALDEVQKTHKVPTVREEIAERVTRARQRIAADELLGVGLSVYRDLPPRR